MNEKLSNAPGEVIMPDSQAGMARPYDGPKACDTTDCGEVCDFDDEDCAQEPCCDEDCGDEILAPREVLRKSNYRFRTFKVEPLNAGFLVHIDCHTIAIETKEKLAQIVSNYIMDPNKVEAAFHKHQTVDSML